MQYTWFFRLLQPTSWETLLIFSPRHVWDGCCLRPRWTMPPPESRCPRWDFWENPTLVTLRLSFSWFSRSVFLMRGRETDHLRERATVRERMQIERETETEISLKAFYRTLAGHTHSTSLLKGLFYKTTISHIVWSKFSIKKITFTYQCNKMTISVEWERELKKVTNQEPKSRI